MDGGSVSEPERLRREAEATEAKLEAAKAGLAGVEAEIAGIAREAVKGGAAKARFAELAERKRGLAEDVELLTAAAAETRSALAAFEERQTPMRLAEANRRIAELVRERNQASDEILASAQTIRAALQRIDAAGREVMELRKSVGSPLDHLPGRFAGYELHRLVERLLRAHLNPPLKGVTCTFGVPFDQFRGDRWLALDREGQDALLVPPPEAAEAAEPETPVTEEAAA